MLRFNFFLSAPEKLVWQFIGKELRSILNNAVKRYEAYEDATR